MNFRLLAALAAALLLVALPPFFDVGAQNVLAKVLIAALFASAFNLLAGQAGLLSFGHAAFFGIGSIATLHLMMAIGGQTFGWPTPLLPLAGGLAGLALGAFVGFFATKRSGVYFALVTVAVAELLYTLAPHWEGVFGGEAGLSSMRMSWAGISFGDSIHVYYLTLAWTVLCIFVLWAYTRTAFGRLTVALRENEQRVRFLGYDTHKTKVIVFSLSAAFSGVAGGLLAVANESANYTLFAGAVSSQVVLHAFIGGSTLFLGPALGAAILTLFGFFVSDWTRSWLIYQGVLFMMVMLYAPTGVAGIVEWHVQRRFELPWRRLAPGYLLGALSAVMMAVALVFAVESVHHLFSDAYGASRRASGGSFPAYELFGWSWSPASVSTWLLPALIGALGGVMMAIARRRIAAILETQNGEAAEAAPPQPQASASQSLEGLALAPQGAGTAAVAKDH